MKKLMLALFGLITLTPQVADGCTIPVFRYALERWELGTYDVLIYHRGPLSAELQAAIKEWADNPSKANLEITVIDLDGKLTAAQRKLWDREGNKDARAWMLVRLQPEPVKGRGPKIDPADERSSWSGPCTPDSLRKMVTSPARQSIVTHMSGGASVVFVLLTSDDAEADSKAYALLRKQLANLEKTIKLPVQSKDGPQLLWPLALKVSLPILLVDRKDAAEAGLVRLLLATENGLDAEKGPIVFPIFGRGRVLGALYDKELTDKQIYEATNFLCKDCSCQVKELNPGIDLLIAADWGRIRDRMFDKKDSPDSASSEDPRRAPDGDSRRTPSEPAPAPKTPEPKRTGSPTSVPINDTQVAPEKVQGAMRSMIVAESEVTPPQAEVRSSGEATAPCPSCLRFWLWTGIVIASGLVVISGAWTLWQMRK